MLGGCALSEREWKGQGQPVEKGKDVEQRVEKTRGENRRRKEQAAARNGSSSRLQASRGRSAVFVLTTVDISAGDEEAGTLSRYRMEARMI